MRFNNRRFNKLSTSICSLMMASGSLFLVNCSDDGSSSGGFDEATNFDFSVYGYNQEDFINTPNGVLPLPSAFEPGDTVVFTGDIFDNTILSYDFNAISQFQIEERNRDSNNAPIFINQSYEDTSSNTAVIERQNNFEPEEAEVVDIALAAINAAITNVDNSGLESGDRDAVATALRNAGIIAVSQVLGQDEDLGILDVDIVDLDSNGFFSEFDVDPITGLIITTTDFPNEIYVRISEQTNLVLDGNTTYQNALDAVNSGVAPTISGSATNIEQWRLLDITFPGGTPAAAYSRFPISGTIVTFTVEEQSNFTMTLNGALETRVDSNGDPISGLFSN